MLTVYAPGPDGRITAIADGAAAVKAGSFIWADLFSTREDDAFRAEEALVEAALGVDAPTPLERAALEESARFYEEGEALFLTATVLGRRAEGPSIAEAVTFILVRDRLVTVRTVKPRAFDLGAGRASARIEAAAGGGQILVALLEGLVERIADILMEATQACHALSLRLFEAPREARLAVEIRTLGRQGALLQLAHTSLSSLSRLCVFVAGVCHRYGLEKARFEDLRRDIAELERGAEALQNHVAFLLAAANGLVTAGQNATLKALSVATIAFVPPTLIASIFGMNFEAMHWFKTGWGPWAAAGLMAAAPAALFLLAKWRKWF